MVCIVLCIYNKVCFHFIIKFVLDAPIMDGMF
jgi:hypothetical protein